MIIDITMTATYRPSLIERTLDSFFSNLFNQAEGIGYRLIINVDPVGSDNNESSEIKRIANLYFKDILFMRPSRPSFPIAFATVWDLASSEFVFHLEEDWILKRKLDFERMLEIMTKNKSLAHLRLNKFVSTKEHVKCWNHFLKWNGEFYECGESDKGSVGWCGHPSLNRLGFIKQALPYLKPHLNPEKQIKSRAMGDTLNKWRFGVFAPNPCPEGCIEDIGREWIKGSGWRKAGNAQHFTVWEKVE